MPLCGASSGFPAARTPLRSTRADACGRRGRSTATDSSRESSRRRSGACTPMPDITPLADGLARSTSRRGFLARASRLVALAAGGTAATALVTPGEATAVTALLKPGDADAFHFCGHIYTTDSCPHPTGLPRIDANGYPLRASDGRPVDDLGRPVNGQGQPVDGAGKPILDPDGRPLPPAKRSRVCEHMVAARIDKPARVDGAWYRCCGGHIRKLVDCCTYTRNRIYGDAALTGYCYAGRRVYCVMYYDTKIPC